MTDPIFSEDESMLTPSELAKASQVMDAVIIAEKGKGKASEESLGKDEKLNASRPLSKAQEEEELHKKLIKEMGQKGIDGMFFSLSSYTIWIISLPHYQPNPYFEEHHQNNEYGDELHDRY